MSMQKKGWKQYNSGSEIAPKMREHVNNRSFKVHANTNQDCRNTQQLPTAICSYSINQSELHCAEHVDFLPQQSPTTNDSTSLPRT
jgi:hypothetical protein